MWISGCLNDETVLCDRRNRILHKKTHLRTDVHGADQFDALCDGTWIHSHPTPERGQDSTPAQIPYI
jgi:hypothetical protein